MGRHCLNVIRLECSSDGPEKEEGCCCCWCCCWLLLFLLMVWRVREDDANPLRSAIHLSSSTDRLAPEWSINHADALYHPPFSLFLFCQLFWGGEGVWTRREREREKPRRPESCKSDRLSSTIDTQSTTTSFPEWPQRVGSRVCASARAHFSSPIVGTERIWNASQKK